MSTAIEKISNLVAKYEKDKHKLMQDVKEEFPKLIMPTIEEYNEHARIIRTLPEIDTISWTQYTPYFNDGDTCTFHRHEDLSLNGESVWDLPEDIYTHEVNRKKEKRKANKLEIALEKLKDILNSIPEECYEDMFGDHCEVEITKDGKINVNEYEHD